MRFHVLATDYDGTLAHDGVVADQTLDALGRLRKSGRRSLLVTGRIIEDLARVFPRLDLFDAVVAENGAVLYDPVSTRSEPLAPPPPAGFAAALRERGVSPLDVGEVIVATWVPYDGIVLETIREQGLDLSVIFNKGAVMVLPAAVTKASGLDAQLARWQLSARNAVGVGDAENDLAFLARCEAAVAVANALPSVKERCDLVTAGDHGRGVRELIDRLIEDDLAGLPALARRRAIPLGTRDDGSELTVPAGCTAVLLAGTSGGGKSTLVAGMLERIAAAGYQRCILDPEGDFEGLHGSIGIGDPNGPPNLDELEGALANGDDVVVSLVAVPVDDRAAFAESLLPRIAELRARLGRPHWLAIDEAHHLVPREAALSSPPSGAGSVLYVTTQPELLAPRVLEDLDAVIAVGDDPAVTIGSALRGRAAVPSLGRDERAEAGEAVVWLRSDPAAASRIRTLPSTFEHRRHVRKYAQGELAEEKSFYFTGPDGKLRLRAQNLMTFVQLAEGVDDETWHHHLVRHDYSGWVARAIGDDELSARIRAIENDRTLGDAESRERVVRAVRERYTAPA